MDDSLQAKAVGDVLLVTDSQSGKKFIEFISNHRSTVRLGRIGYDIQRKFGCRPTIFLTSSPRVHHASYHLLRHY
jgi:hypothetical protein